jgi:DNA polymerase III sliding clamp (beta) subunit (PCNA family)
MLVSKSLLSVIATASNDDSRPLLTCIKLYKEDGKVVSVSTDSYILAEVIEQTPAIDEYPELPHDHKPTDPDEVLMPASTAKRLSDAIKKGGVLPVLNYALVESDTATTTDLEEVTTLTFRSPEGNYPKYRELIERESAKQFYTTTINPKYLKKALAMFKDDTDVDISVSSDKYAPVFLRTDSAGIKKTVAIMPLKK